MFGFDEDVARLAERVVAEATARLRDGEPALGRPRSEAELTERVGHLITAAGLGPDAAMDVWEQVLDPATMSTAHPMFLAFVASAATPAASLFDFLVTVNAADAGGWLYGAGAIHAENQALDWLAGLAGMPATSAGVFLSGGSAGNLNGLVTAHDWALRRRDGARPGRWRIAAAGEAHSSVRGAACVMDAEVFTVPGDDRGRLTGDRLRHALTSAPDDVRDSLFAVTATAGTTNAGVVDDLAGVAAACAEHGLWLHVDAAYGGAALAAPSRRRLFDGVERADSLVIDPHKWLFAPFDSAALLYADGDAARRAHTLRAAYLDVMDEQADPNPSDLAFHLTRRARGLPFWFSLVANGTDAYTAAIEACLRLTEQVAQDIHDRPFLELAAAPDLSIVLFRRVGWSAADYQAWSEETLSAGVALCTPTSLRDETVLRCCFVNPRTSRTEVVALLDSLC